MNKYIIESLTEEKLLSLARLWEVKDRPEVLDEVNNLVYAVDVEGASRILRITHSSHRGRGEILSELDFIQYLAGRGLPVCRALPSCSGRLVETLPVEEGEFYAVAFEKARGEFIKMSDPLHWNPAFFRYYGEVVGRMHAAAREYQPAPGIRARYHWEKDIHPDALKLVPPEEKKLAEDYATFVEKLRALPRPAEGYGLVHNDINPTNFCVENGRMMLFDFDDCCYHWFIHDLATAIPMNFSAFRREGWREQVEQLLVPFLRGYLEQYPLDIGWFSLLSEMLRLENANTLIFCYADDIEHSPYADFFRAVRQTNHEGHPLFTYDFEALVRRILG